MGDGMLWIFRCIKGFLKVSLFGQNAERLINTASKKGINLFNIRYNKSKITAFVSITDFKRIFNLHQNKDVNIKIDNKIGLPFIIHRYRRRVGLLIGGMIFLVLLEFLSSFIWTVEVNGNKIVPTDEIISACKKMGVYEGVPISKINTKNAADKLLLEVPSLAWGSLNIEGSVVTVNVTEVKNQPKNNEGLPSNIVASEDAIIKKLDVTSGNSLVKVGDAVANGDVLVSGIIENMNSTVFVHSRGSVIAEVEKEFKAHSKFNEILKKPTGKVKKRLILSALGVDIPLYFKDVNTPSIAKTKIKRLKVLDKKLPFSIIQKTYNLTENKKITLSGDKLKEKLYANIKKQMAEYKNSEITVLDENYMELSDGAELKIKCLILTDIAMQKEIKVITGDEVAEK